MADLGTDLDFDADLDPTFSLCSGRTAYAQAILHRFGAQRGAITTVSGDASYGYDLLMMLNADFDGPAIPYWRSCIVQQCLLDERTLRADCSIVERPAEDKIEITIALVDSEGPFQLVLEVNRVAQNIKILQGAPT